MNRGRKKSPSPFPPIAAVAVTMVAVVLVAGPQFGLFESPFGAKDKPKAVARVEPKPVVKPRPKPKPKPKPIEVKVPEAPPIVVHEEPEIESPAKPATMKSPARLAYEKKAEGLPDKAKAHADLARSLQKDNLPEEAREAWQGVIRLDPNHAEARKALGYRRYESTWMTEAMIEDLTEQRKADREWKERLTILHNRMHKPRDKNGDADAQEAVAEVAKVDDPRAAPALWHVFAGHPSHHLMVARQLAKLKSPRSSLMLAAVAAYSPDEKAGRTSLEELKTRDPVEFARQLIALLGPELKYKKSTLPTEPGGPVLQALEIEDERIVQRFVYFAAASPADLSSGAFGDCSAMVRWANFGWSSDGKAMARQLNKEQARQSKQMADSQLQSDIDAVNALNDRIRKQNGRVQTILAETTGKDFGLDRDAWNTWLAPKLGMKYTTPKQVAKVQLQDFVQPIYQPSFIAIPPTPT